MRRNKRKLPHSAKKKLSLEGQIVKVLMENQPLQKDDLKKHIKIGQTQLWRTLALLEHEGIIRSSLEGFVLFSFNDLDAKVSFALRRFKAMGYEAVGIYDLANIVGVPPSRVEESAFKLARDHGLKIESMSRRRQPPIKTYGSKLSEHAQNNV